MKISSTLAGGVLLASLLAAFPASPLQAAPTYTAKKEGYSINLPGKPKVGSRSMAFPGMGQSTVNFVTAAKPPMTFVVIPLKLPGTASGTTANRFLDGVQKGFTQSPTAKLLSSKKISLNGAPGREVVVQAGANLMHGRFFVKGNRSYQVVAISPKNGAAKYQPQVVQVLNSFRILN